MQLPRWFILTVGIVSLALWVTSFILTAFNPSFKPDASIGYAAMTVVSVCFTTEIIRGVAKRVKDKLEAAQKALEDEDITKPTKLS